MKKNEEKFCEDSEQETDKEENKDVKKFSSNSTSLISNNQIDDNIIKINENKNINLSNNEVNLKYLDSQFQDIEGKIDSK